MRGLFVDRVDAGKQLARHFQDYVDRENVVVLALPRGGVPVGYEIAAAIKAPLDVFLVRKLGVPWQQELAMGAIASGNVPVFNDELIQQIGISQDQIHEVIAKEQAVLHERENKYLAGRKPTPIKNKTVILVDDGIATGATIRAAIMAIKKLNAAKLIVAVPVAPPDTIEQIRLMVDDVICLHTPFQFFAIGNWYENFSQTEDSEVISLLEKSKEHQHE